MVDKKRCNVSKWYKAKNTAKLIVIWDILRVLLPIFYFWVLLLLYLHDEDGKTIDNWAILGTFMVKTSPDKDAADLKRQLTTLSLLVGEMFRTLMIAVVGIFAFYKGFSYITTGTYFWVRTLNLASQLFLFLILGANIITLIVTSLGFMLDGYLSYILYVYWQNLKWVKSSSVSSSAQSELSNGVVVDGDCLPRQSQAIIEEIKRGCGGSDMLDLEDNDRSFGLPRSHALTKNEESKEVVMCSLPPVIKNRENRLKEDYTRATGLFEDVREYAPRKDSLMDGGTSWFTREPVTIVRAQYSSTNARKKEFFTSGHIQVIEKGYDNENEKSKTLKKAPAIDSRFSRTSKDDPASEKRLVNSEGGDRDNSSKLYEKDYMEYEVKLNYDYPLPKVKRNATNSPLKNSYRPRPQSQKEIPSVNDKEQNRSDTGLRGKVKNFKFTNQLECLDKVSALPSDAKDFKSNRE